MLSVNELEDRLIDLAFAEDIGDGDHTTLCCIFINKLVLSLFRMVAIGFISVFLYKVIRSGRSLTLMI